jgi:DNA-binding transcriptional ArsR family regulator
MNPATFAALAHDLRLKVFRLLLAKCPDGMPAGQIALRLEVPASTLSTHLAQLERVGLLRSWRERQRIVYAVDTGGTTRLVDFLVRDCCGGEPGLCGYSGAGKATSRPKRGRKA